ncbi:hypothetical protein [Solihabitans fulvus]|uniref:hypothetical protein n=1 Tax=Solihabitans fulvus TaxID=1892852 RepID=UPI001661EC30|nr:hypothetical protein [Solihabitans fulvus]
MSVVLGLLVGSAALPSAANAASAPPRIDLRVLVVTDGTPWVEAIRAELAAEGAPATVVTLGDSTRPQLTSAFLADQLSDGTPHAKFQGVVLPSQAPTGLGAAELTALSSFEQDFAVRQITGFAYPNVTVGENSPLYSGALDGTTAQVTPAAAAAGFGYLAGPVTFEDNDPTMTEAYGYLATARPDDPATGAHFEPFLTASVPGTSTTGVLAGVYRASGIEQLVLNFAYNGDQQQFKVVSHGIVTWLTRGVHLGYYRNYLSVHVDDLFGADDRWNIAAHCTPGNNDCPPGTPDTTPIRMTPQDAVDAAAWQTAHDFRFDFLFNGGSSDEIVADQGSDPLTTTLQSLATQFRWVNHTYTHEFLGCVQDFTVIPWRCATDPATGQTAWVSQQFIDDQIAKNLTFAQQHGLAVVPDELVAGEHSGTLILPQQPQDNPNFLAALQADGIGWLGMDASREPAQRQVASALGVPRHPINVFYNVANPAEEVAEYNWIYTSRADGGSGICEDHPDTTTCIKPLDGATGYQSYILPLESRIALGHVLGNDPRPHYVHQSNLAEGRLLYPLLENILSTYRAEFAANAPVVSPSLTDSGVALQRQAAWQATRDAGTVSAYEQGGAVTVEGTADASVPVTVPDGTTVNGAAFGDAYAGERSGYADVGPSRVLTLTRPSARTQPSSALRVPAARIVASLATAPRPSVPNQAAPRKANIATAATLPRAAK